MIYTYTRKQAIADGVLVDITDIAKGIGFVIPVAITATLFDRYVRPTPELDEYGESQEARLADVLTVSYSPKILHRNNFSKQKNMDLDTWEASIYAS